MRNNELRSYSTKELAALYEISVQTMRKWLHPFKEEIGKKIGRFYKPLQVKIIFSKLGLPPGWESLDEAA